MTDIDLNKQLLLDYYKASDCPESLTKHFIQITDMLCQIDFDDLIVDYNRMDKSISIKLYCKNDIFIDMAIFNNDMSVLCTIYRMETLLFAGETLLSEMIDFLNYIS